MRIAWHSAETPLFGVCEACFQGIVNIHIEKYSKQAIGSNKLL